MTTDRTVTPQTPQLEAELMSPADRRMALELEISRLHADGLRVESRCGHQAVLRALVPPRRRTQIFVDEFGNVLRS
jgi:hypothetical protein